MALQKKRIIRLVETASFLRGEFWSLKTKQWMMDVQHGQVTSQRPLKGTSKADTMTTTSSSSVKALASNSWKSKLKSRRTL